MIKKIFGHSILYTLSNNVPLFSSIIILPIITPYLTIKDYAIYGLLHAYLGGLNSLSNLGMDIHFQNSYFKNKDNYQQEWNKIFGMIIPIRVLFSILITVVLYLVFKNDVAHIYLFLFLVMVPLLFFSFSSSIASKLCQYEGKHQFVYFSTFISSIINISLSFYTIYFLRLGYMGWLIASFFSSFISFLLLGYLLHVKYKIIPRFNYTFYSMKKLLKISIPIIPHKYSSYLMNNSDRVILDLYQVPLKYIGTYNVAYNFSSYFSSFNSSLNTVLSPIYFKLFALNDNNKSREIVSLITVLWFIFISLSCILISIWAKEIIDFLYRNDDFDSIYVYVPFLLISFLAHPFYVAAVDNNIYKENTKSILKITVIGGLINLILNIITIPFWGIKAAVLSTFISYMYTGFSGYFIKDLKKNILFKYNPFIFIGLILVVSSICISVINLNFFLKISLSLMIVLIFFFSYQLKIKFVIKELNQENLI
jgi:O-antigen/teichoic acid export membrane protein